MEIINYRKGELFMPYGYTGKILRINLSNNKIWIDKHDE